MQQDTPIRADGSSDDGRTHLSVSELSTKPNSLDGKSVTSGTTFGLDEKESLRPDDSASVKAAEDEDLLSGNGSGAQGSILGSEADPRVPREHFLDGSEKLIINPVERGLAAARIPPHTLLESRAPGNLLNHQSPEELRAHLLGPCSPPASHLPQSYTDREPDEKLIEALETPKDRLFLLRLEQEMIEFVKVSKQDTLDLPPCNSFYRLLTHKLADYYLLTHYVDNSVNAVRLWRTPFSRLRTPLTMISKPSTSSGTPPSTTPAVKIMRRNGKDEKGTSSDGQPTINSEAPSKSSSDIEGECASDNGNDPLKLKSEPLSAKERAALTREEREAKYNEVRDRIFGNDPPASETTTESTPLEQTEEISRTSSANGGGPGGDKFPNTKKKANSKRQRKAGDDSFEVRSQFTTYYKPVEYPAPAFPLGQQVYAPFTQPFAPNGPAAQIGTVPYMGSQQHQQYNPPFQHPSQGDMAPFQYQMSTPQYFGPGIDDPRVPEMNRSPMNSYQAIQPQWIHQQQPQMQHMPPKVLQMTNSPPTAYHQIQPQQPHAQPQPLPINQAWQRPPYQNTFQPKDLSFDRLRISSNTGPPYGQYPYGQLPSVNYANNPPINYQHPIPGSFNRHAFNPQTQSFIPGGVMPNNQPTYYRSPVQGSSPNISPHQSHFNNNYRMQRQGSNNSSALTSPHLVQANVTSYPTSNAPPSNYTSNPAKTPNPNPYPVQSTISKWGTPSHLPPKPPPPQSMTPLNQTAMYQNAPRLSYPPIPQGNSGTRFINPIPSHNGMQNMG
ncbi:MAG: hypothetical protein M1829_004363 [Trizodia sp. TS-e1964]|nr:MAG: hypothetical protein M1829_004363 [Trizodia sp. TS-e1964]